MMFFDECERDACVAYTKNERSELDIQFPDIAQLLPEV